MASSRTTAAPHAHGRPAIRESVGPISRRRASALRALVVFSVLLPLLIYPFAKMMVRTFDADGQIGLTYEMLRETLTSSGGRSAIWGTVWLTTVTLLLAVPVATGLAWATALTDAPLVRKLAMLPILSLAVPPLVGTIGWLILLSPRAGLINTIIRDLVGSSVDEGPFNAFSLPVIVGLMALYAVPYIYGPVYAALRRIDASLVEAATVAGTGGVAVFFSVVVPLIRPALLAGGLIGGVMAASNFVIPLVLASGTGLRVIPTYVYRLVTQQGQVAPAVVLGLLLSSLTVVGMLFYLRALRAGAYTTVTGKGVRPVTLGLGRFRYAVSTMVVGYLVVAIVLPLLCLLYISLVGFWSADVFSQPLSLQAYESVFDRSSSWRALRNSAWMAAAGATLAVTLGLLIAASQRGLRGSRVLSGLSVLATLPMGIPAIVVGIAFLVSYSTGPAVLYGSALLIVLAYCVHQLPIGLRNSDAALRQVSHELDEAAKVSGANGAVRWRDLYLPLLRQPLLAAWAICFIVLFRDLPISILLYTPRTLVSSVALLNIFERGSMPPTAAYAIAITAVSVAGVALVAVVARTSSRIGGQREGGLL